MQVIDHLNTQDLVFPDNVALPIGGTNNIHTHCLLEMHYDNPDELSGKIILIDSILYAANYMQV